MSWVPVNIDRLNEEQLRFFLKLLISKLDDLDQEGDIFGTEGWREYLQLI